MLLLVQEKLQKHNNVKWLTYRMWRLQVPRRKYKFLRSSKKMFDSNDGGASFAEVPPAADWVAERCASVHRYFEGTLGFVYDAPADGSEQGAVPYVGSLISKRMRRRYTATFIGRTTRANIVVASCNGLD